MTGAPRQAHDAVPPSCVLWGLGSGRRARALLRAGHRVEVLALDVDPSRPEQARAVVAGCEELHNAMQHGELIVRVAQPAHLASRFQGLADACPRPQLEVDLAALMSVPQPAQALARMIERIHIERRDVARFGSVLRDNLRRNLDASASAISFEALAGTARGRLGVVLAAGPSASASLEWIAATRNVAPLIAVDTALPMCERACVSIDYLASVDPHAASAVHLQRGTTGVGALAFQPYASPAVVAAFSERVLALPAGDLLCDAVAERTGLPRLPVAGTVLLYALQLAAQLGCDPIIVVGADFAHVGGRSHAEGTATSVATSPSGITALTRHNREVASSTSLLRFRSDIERHIANTSAHHIAVDGGGAAIAGTRMVDRHAVARWLQRRMRTETPWRRAPLTPASDDCIATQRRIWSHLLDAFSSQG